VLGVVILSVVTAARRIGVKEVGFFFSRKRSALLGWIWNIELFDRIGFFLTDFTPPPLPSPDGNYIRHPFLITTPPVTHPFAHSYRLVSY